MQLFHVGALEEYQRIPLEEMRDHHPKPYMRERAAALLKLADGLSIAFVAHWGFLQTLLEDCLYLAGGSL